MKGGREYMLASTIGFQRFISAVKFIHGTIVFNPGFYLAVHDLHPWSKRQ